MVLHEQFPMFRLATLLARQLSSPIATRIKEYAKRHPRFGRAVCMRSGRAAAAAELRFKLWTLQLRGAGAGSPVLSDSRALDAGADLIGEVILFGLGAAIVTFEYNRQAIKQEEKVDAERSAWLAVQLQVQELQHELRAQQRDLDRLSTRLSALARPVPAQHGPASREPETPRDPHGPASREPETPRDPHGPASREPETPRDLPGPASREPETPRELHEPSTAAPPHALYEATKKLCPCPEPEPSTDPPL